MAQNVTVSGDMIALARKEAELQGRTVSEQIGHWLMLGRALEKTNDFDFARVSAAIAGKLETTELTAAEDAVWMAFFTDLMAEGLEGGDELFAKIGNGEKV